MGVKRDTSQGQRQKEITINQGHFITKKIKILYERDLKRQRNEEIMETNEKVKEVHLLENWLLFTYDIRLLFFFQRFHCFQLHLILVVFIKSLIS